MLGVPFYLRDYTVIGASDLPYDSVVLSSSTAVYESASQSSNQRSTEAAGKTYPYKGEEGDFYKVDYDGFYSGYVLKSASRLVPAGTGSASVIGSYTLSMQKGIDTVNDYQGTIKYDEIAKQYYVKYIKDDKSHMVWLEDNGSVKWRMDFVNDYNLGGMGAWSLGTETLDIWEIVKTKLK
jgi:GH18 family chitinase